MWMPPDIAPQKMHAGREQNLFIGQMKHLYVLKDGTLKWQAKALDPRIPGKTLITRFVLLDTDSGSVYGECHTDETKQDLAGFLARAWSVKPDHSMHGIPELLNVPQLVRKNENYRNDIDCIVEYSGVVVGALPAGFVAGVHAVKQFDEQVRSLIWQCDFRKVAPTLAITQSCSAVISNQIRPMFSGDPRELWASVAPAPESFFAAVDKLYKQPGGWRRGPFELDLSGVKNPTGK